MDGEYKRNKLVHLQFSAKTYNFQFPNRCAFSLCLLVVGTRTIRPWDVLYVPLLHEKPSLTDRSGCCNCNLASLHPAGNTVIQATSYIYIYIPVADLAIDVTVARSTYHSGHCSLAKFVQKKKRLQCASHFLSDR